MAGTPSQQLQSHPHFQHLLRCARRIIASKINDDTWGERTDLVRRESLATQLMQARQRGNTRRVERLERAIRIGPAPEAGD